MTAQRIEPDADDWMEDLLRQELRAADAPAVTDAGFTARVMTALPPPVALPAWRRPALTALWASAGLGIAATLPGIVVDTAHEVLGFLASQRLTLTQAGIGFLVLAAASWAGSLYTLGRDD